MPHFPCRYRKHCSDSTHHPSHHISPFFSPLLPQLRPRRECARPEHPRLQPGPPRALPGAAFQARARLEPSDARDEHGADGPRLLPADQQSGAATREEPAAVLVGETRGRVRGERKKNVIHSISPLAVCCRRRADPPVCGSPCPAQAVCCGETIKVISRIVDAKGQSTFVDVQACPPSPRICFFPSPAASRPLKSSPTDRLSPIPRCVIVNAPLFPQDEAVVLDRQQITKVSWTEDGQASNKHARDGMRAGRKNEGRACCSRSLKCPSANVPPQMSHRRFSPLPPPTGTSSATSLPWPRLQPPRTRVYATSPAGCARRWDGLRLPVVVVFMRMARFFFLVNTHHCL